MKHLCSLLIAERSPTGQEPTPRAELTLPEATTPEELETPEAVAPEERMKAYPSPGEYAAFSLSVAQKLVTRVGQKTTVRCIPRSTTWAASLRFHGLVHDRQRRDLILVGKYDPERQPLTLDDFAVAVRARFIHGKWPLLSIDPTEPTQATVMQTVRTEGGIEDTQFGADLFDADYRLKRIGMGLLAAAVPGLNTYWDLNVERAKQGQGGSQKIGSRFWFYPVLPNVSVREDVVAVQGLILNRAPDLNSQSVQNTFETSMRISGNPTGTSASAPAAVNVCRYRPL